MTAIPRTPAEDSYADLVRAGVALWGRDELGLIYPGGTERVHEDLRARQRHLARCGAAYPTDIIAPACWRPIGTRSEPKWRREEALPFALRRAQVTGGLLVDPVAALSDGQLLDAARAVGLLPPILPACLDLDDPALLPLKRLAGPYLDGNRYLSWVAERAYDAGGYDPHDQLMYRALVLAGADLIGYTEMAVILDRAVQSLHVRALERNRHVEATGRPAPGDLPEPVVFKGKRHQPEAYWLRQQIVDWAQLTGLLSQDRTPILSHRTRNGRLRTGSRRR